MAQSFSENQIIQMAQQEDSMLSNKKSYLNSLSNILLDTIKTIESLKEIQKKPKKLMMRLGAGVLVDVKIEQTESCQRTFSEKGYKKEKISDTIKWLEDKKEKLGEQLTKVKSDIATSETRLTELMSIIKQIEAEKAKNISVK